MTDAHPEPNDEAGPSPVTGERDVPDEALPEDLRPDDDHPLAQPPEDAPEGD
ncbi:MAG: hypothetical protein ACTHJH_03365 [Marmoricola sp.]